MEDPKKKQADDEFAKRHPWAASMALKGPWTEADEIWLECMTGDYDRRIAREAFEREAADSDL